MQYMGSKKSLAKLIIPIILEYRKPGQWWVEPFVGGANIIDKVTGDRLGGDINKYLISLLCAARDGYIPPCDVSREMYYHIKANPDEYPSELVGFVGFACSFGGKWWGGYAFNNSGYNYAAAGSRVITAQAKKLKGVIFKAGDYLKMDIPEGSIIYCDPPYAGSEQYKDKIDYDVFWGWCRTQAKNGHNVFISEYSAPNDFCCVKEMNHKTLLDKNKKQHRIEKLFMYKGV